MSTSDSVSFQSIPASQALLSSNSRMQVAASDLAALPGAEKPLVRNAGYGLPCAKCRTYYSAALATCPVCKSSERVSAISFAVPATPVSAERTPDPKVLEEERERFLQEFRSQSFLGPLQIQASENFHCSKEENHEGSFEPASVCQGCYDQLRTRVDLAEAALLMDAKEAAHLVYEAVWSDPSDPSKTYVNAAQALLNELRRRAGIPTVLGPFQTLTD
jgi:hypothetical protein